MVKAIINFNQSDYVIEKRDVAYQGIFQVAKYQLKHRLFNGNWSKLLNREVLERRAAVAVLPYDPKTDQVVLIAQFRPGALANPESPWLIETVAGLIEPDEKPQHVAIRETHEESGCEALDLYPICQYFVSPGGSNEYLYLYCGRIQVPAFDGVYGLASENEDIQTFTLLAEEAFHLVQEGQIKTPPAIIALQWLQLNRDWLRQLWLK